MMIIKINTYHMTDEKIVVDLFDGLEIKINDIFIDDESE